MTLIRFVENKDRNAWYISQVRGMVEFICENCRSNLI